MTKRTILITGGTGSFGKAYLEKILKSDYYSKIIIFSRDEMKQWEMSNALQDPRLRFFIGDVRDRNRLQRAMDGMTDVVHAAATKIVPTAEYNPFEAVKTNIIGASNVIDAAIDNGVSKVIALSTDKASSPINLYGATKLVSDKLFVAANNYSGSDGTAFSVVRYGNVMGSRGSLIPFLLSLDNSQRAPLTDERMTRFMISLEQAISLVETAFKDMQGGEIFVRKIPSMRVIDVIESVRPDLGVELVGVRPGEKIHEQMIGPDEYLQTFDFGDHYRILPIGITDLKHLENFGGTMVPAGFLYSSDTNEDWMSKADLKSWLQNFRTNGGKS